MTGWHMAACWRAIESVADQLGDPPRYRRYAELAAGREDLPSGNTMRVRLGPWTGIAAALRDHHGGTRAAERDGRVVTVREARALAYLRAHPDASGIAVGRATAMGHYSQAWKVLARLERQGMLASRRVGRAKSWSLTERGRAVLEGLPEGMYA